MFISSVKLLINRFYMIKSYVNSDYKKAIEYGNKCILLNSNHINNQLLLAECYWNINDGENAEKCAKQVLILDQNNYDATNILIEICYSQNRYDDTYNYINSLLDNRDKYVPSIPINIGNTNLSLMDKIYSNIKGIFNEDDKDRNEIIKWAENFKEWYESSMKGNHPELPNFH